MTKKEIQANIDTMTIAEIKALIDEIEHKVEHWKRCKDGSYEMALSEAGGYILWNKYHELKRAENQ